MINYDHFKHTLHFMCNTSKRRRCLPASHNLRKAKTLKVAKGLVTVTWHRWNSNLEKIFRWRNQGFRYWQVKKLLLWWVVVSTHLNEKCMRKSQFGAFLPPKKSGWNFPKIFENATHLDFPNHEPPRSKRDEFLMTSHYNHPRSDGYSDGEKAAVSQHFDMVNMVN